MQGVNEAFDKLRKQIEADEAGMPVARDTALAVLTILQSFVTSVARIADALESESLD